MNYSETWKVEWTKVVLQVSGMTDLFPKKISPSLLLRQAVRINDEASVVRFDLGFARDKKPFCTKDLVGFVHHWDTAFPEAANVIRIFTELDDHIDIQLPLRE